MNSPREVIISITNRCNLRCKMCDIPSNKNEELSTSCWERVIYDAASCGAGAIVFSGGEPLLREDIFELISFAKKNSLRACLTSNGYFLSDEVTQKIRQAGIDVVNISIEGPRRIHDYLRGRGMFERATVALGILRKHKIEATVATMVSRYNYKYLTCIMEIAKQYGATTVKFQPFNRIFLNKPDRGGSFLISNREIEKLAGITEDITGLARKYAISINPAGYLAKMPSYLGKKYIGIGKGCTALENSCPINCNGDIYPCWVLSEKDNLIGNINKSSFLEVWGSHNHEAIIESVKRDGCPGCMMSCYDENFGKEPIERRIIMSMARLREKGAAEYARSILNKLTKRIKFYSSYRGSLQGIVRRIHGSLQRNKEIPLNLRQEESDNVLKEIEFAKKILKEELIHSKCK